VTCGVRNIMFLFLIKLFFFTFRNMNHIEKIMENSRAVQKQQGLKSLTLSLRNTTNILGESVRNGDRYTRTRDWVDKQ